MAKKNTVIRHTLELDDPELYLIIAALRFKASTAQHGSKDKGSLDKMVDILTGDAHG